MYWRFSKAKQHRNYEDFGKPSVSKPGKVSIYVVRSAIMQRVRLFVSCKEERSTQTNGISKFEFRKTTEHSISLRASSQHEIEPCERLDGQKTAPPLRRQANAAAMQYI
jgi:hypothetical protein